MTSMHQSGHDPVPPPWVHHLHRAVPPGMVQRARVQCPGVKECYGLIIDVKPSWTGPILTSGPDYLTFGCHSRAMLQEPNMSEGPRVPRSIQSIQHFDKSQHPTLMRMDLHHGITEFSDLMVGPSDLMAGPSDPWPDPQIHGRTHQSWLGSINPGSVPSILARSHHEAWARA